MTGCLFWQKNGLLSTDFKVQPQEGPHKQAEEGCFRGQKEWGWGEGAAYIQRWIQGGQRKTNTAWEGRQEQMRERVREKWERTVVGLI